MQPLVLELHTSSCILVPRAYTPFGQHQERPPLARSDFLSMCRGFLSYSWSIRFMGVARIFQRGGDRLIQRVLIRLSPEYCKFFAYKKAYKGGGHPRTPPGYAYEICQIRWEFCESWTFNAGPAQRSQFLLLTKMSAASGDENAVPVA